MKKILAALILLFFITTNSCYAFSELYYFKNIKTSDVEPLVSDSINYYGFRILKQNPFYAVSDNNDTAIVILQQSGNNMFYYYRADKNTRINKSVLKEIKKRNIICEQSFNTNLIGIYDEIADSLLNTGGNPIQYTFDEPKNNITQTKVPKQENNSFYGGYITQIASGTKFNVYLQNAINTATASQGDSVIAVVQDGINYGNTVIIPQGSLVYGTLKKARSAKYGSISGRIVIDFNKIVTPDNHVYNISTENIDFAVANEGKVAESAKNAASTAAVGAIVGLLVGLLSDNGHVGRSAAIGAGIGAGSSLVYSVAEKGADAEIPSFTELELTLKEPIKVNVTK